MGGKMAVDTYMKNNGRSFYAVYGLSPDWSIHNVEKRKYACGISDEDIGPEGSEIGKNKGGDEDEDEA
jgi:hypothetical protein